MVTNVVPFLFWGIKRQAKDEETPNCEIVKRQAVDLKMIQKKPADGKDACIMVLPECVFENVSYDMTFPFITNKQKIKANEELILKHGVRKKRGKGDGKGKGRSWVDDLGQRASKKQKAEST